MNRTIFVIILACLFATVLIPIGCTGTTPRLGEVISIPELKSSAGTKYIGKTVTVEGIFVRDPLPMLVTSLDIVIVNMPMPKDQYILLSGDAAERIDPKDFGGAKLRVTGTVNAPDTSENKPQEIYISDIYFEMIERLVLYSPELMKIKIIENLTPDTTRFAILFSGGLNSANNHIRYWNDLKFMYKTLIGTLGFSKNNIAVLYADGKARDTDMPVNYKATKANLQIVFSLLRQHSAPNDFIFFFTTNHGGGFEKSNTSAPLGVGSSFLYHRGQWDADGDEPNDLLSESDYNLDLNGDGDKVDTVSWDEELCTWGGEIYDDVFHNMVGNLKFSRMVTVMEQCFSGGLIHDMSQGGNRIIISAAGEYEPSWAMPPSYEYNEFSYYFTCAINKADHQGNTINADSDNNGHVSLVEAFNYARSKDTRSETPWYEDNGDGLPHSGAMPASSEGTLGSSTTLEP